MTTPAPTDPIRTATEDVLATALAFAHTDADPGSGTHAKSTAYAEFMHALMNYHMAELALIRRDDATGPQRPIYLEAAEHPIAGQLHAVTLGATSSAVACLAVACLAVARGDQCVRPYGHDGKHLDDDGLWW